MVAHRFAVNWVGGSQVHPGSCSWHRRSGEARGCYWGCAHRACCATLTPVGNYKPASESRIAGCPLPSALCLLTWERKSKPYIKWEFTLRFKSMAEDPRGVQNTVLAKCIQLPLQMSLINWENPLSLNILLVRRAFSPRQGWLPRCSHMQYNQRGWQVTTTPYLSVAQEMPLLCLLLLFGFCSEGQNNSTSFFITHTPCACVGWLCTQFSCVAMQQLSAAMSTTRSDLPGTVLPVLGTEKSTLPFKFQSAKQSHATKTTTKEKIKDGKEQRFTLFFYPSYEKRTKVRTGFDQGPVVAESNTFEGWKRHADKWF